MQEIFGREQLDEWLIENNNKVTVLYFGTPWCGPCKALKVRLAKQTDMPNIKVCYINAEDQTNIKLTEKYKIEAFPTLIFVKINNLKIKETGRVIGYDWMKTISEYTNY
jgi:thiol-disulfide isomerase/thioredoxin